ncbi:MAG: methyltransferase family protein [Candidatus Sericytochromatia bacterium]
MLIDDWRVAALGIVLVTFALSELCYPRRRPRAHRLRDRFSSEALMAATILNLAALPLLAGTRLGALPETGGLAPGLGLGLAVGGVALRFWAIATLGGRFTSAVVVGEEQPVIAHGPYRWLRHPGYAAVVAFGCGVALLVESGFALALFLATYGGAVLYRVRVEELAMQEVLGERYAAYAARTPWRLLPWLY